MKTTIHDCRLIELPRGHDQQGTLTTINSNEEVPFHIVRTYYLYDIPGGESRGAHAHKELQQLIVSVMGAFDVVLNDGREEKTIRLDRAYYGLYIPRLIWRELINFSSGATCLVLASLPYIEKEYLREYDAFIRFKEQNKKWK